MSKSPPLTPFGSALAGALGAVFSNALVYPLDTVKTRLQALPSSELAAITAIPQTSINIDKSITTNTVTTTDLTGPSSGEDEQGSAKAKKQDKQVIRKSGNPLPVVIQQFTKLIVGRLRKWAMLAMLVRILRTEGLAGAFKGFSASMINTFSQQFAYFFFHTALRSYALQRLVARSPISSSPSPLSLSVASELSLGAAAGGLAQIFTIPVAVIATRQQLYISTPTHKDVSTSKSVIGESSDSRSQTPGLIETAREIIAEGGWQALWTGLKPGLVLTVNPAITYGVFERGKSLLLADRPGGKLGVAEAFWLGVLSKTMATIVTYPYIFAKVRLQAKLRTSQLGDTPSSSSYAAVASQPPLIDSAVVPSEKHQEIPASDTTNSKLAVHKHSRGALSILHEVYKEHGMTGWYQGMTAQIVKAVLCQGILFVSKDQFEAYAANILALIK